MRIFITGVAGFLGSNLAEELVRLGHDVEGNDNFSAGDIENVTPQVTVHDASCESKWFQSILREANPDVVYHCAAHPHEGLSVFSPHTICKSIFEASVSVFSAAAQCKVKRVVFCSSMSRYGPGAPPFRETDPVQPVDPYAIAKVAAEDVLRCLSRVHGFEYVVAVPHNIVGKNQKYDDPFRNVAAIMANRMLLGMQPIVYGDGQQTRCFSDVRDVLDTMVQLATVPGISGEVYNVGPDEEVITIEQLGRELADVIGVPWNPLRLPPRPCEVRYAHCSSQRIRDWFGYRTRYSLRETLQSLVDYIRERGPREFSYYLPVEIVNDKTPRFWIERI